MHSMLIMHTKETNPYRTAKAYEVLSPPQVNAVIEQLLYTATPEQRAALMAHCPVAYAALCGNHPTIREAVLFETGKAINAEEKR